MSVPTRSDVATVTVEWIGDDGAGSGVANYDVQVRVDGGGWSDWHSATTATQDTYTGEPGHAYTFRARGRDAVGNVGAWVEAEVSVAGVTKYYAFGGGRVAMRTPDGVFYLHTDHLGSTSLATTAAGGVHSRQGYYPYGETRYTAGTLPTDFGFTGQRNDATIGLYDYQARWYNPALGRFISADTLVPDSGNPQDLNRYAYVRNNPLKYIDSSGHLLDEAGSGGGRGIPPQPPPEQPPSDTVAYLRWLKNWKLWLTRYPGYSAGLTAADLEEEIELTENWLDWYTDGGGGVAQQVGGYIARNPESLVPVGMVLGEWGSEELSAAGGRLFDAIRETISNLHGRGRCAHCAIDIHEWTGDPLVLITRGNRYRPNNPLRGPGGQDIGASRGWHAITVDLEKLKARDNWGDQGDVSTYLYNIALANPDDTINISFFDNIDDFKNAIFRYTNPLLFPD